jgi:cbb3-type cytochrome oxidase maturation protein
MQSFYLLVPLALVIIALAIKLLFWAINNGQYDDLDTEGHRILFDEEKQSGNESKEAVEHHEQKDSHKNK